MAIKYKSKMKVSFMLGTTIGVVTCLLLWIGVSAILTSFVLKETVQTKSLSWIIPVTQGGITFLGAFIAGAVINDKKHISSLICGGVYLGIITCFVLLFAEGIFCGYWAGTTCIVIGCVAAVLSHMTKKRTSPGKRRGKRLR